MAYPENTTPQNTDDQVLTLKKILLALSGAGPDGPIPVAPSSAIAAGSNLPYGADEQVLTNVVGGPGPTVIVYKKSGVTVKTRTLTYTGSGPTDVLIHTVDT